MGGGGGGQFSEAINVGGVAGEIWVCDVGLGGGGKVATNRTRVRTASLATTLVTADAGATAGGVAGIGGMGGSGGSLASSNRGGDGDFAGGGGGGGGAPGPHTSRGTRGGDGRQVNGGAGGGGGACGDFGDPDESQATDGVAAAGIDGAAGGVGYHGTGAGSAGVGVDGGPGDPDTGGGGGGGGRTSTDGTDGGSGASWEYILTLPTDTWMESPFTWTTTASARWAELSNGTVPAGGGGGGGGRLDTSADNPGRGGNGGFPGGGGGGGGFGNNPRLGVGGLGADGLLLIFYEGEADIETDTDCESGVDFVYPPCVTNWTQCVRIVRRDDLTFRFTTLDRDFEFRGEDYLTCNSLTPSALQAFGDLSDVGSTEISGLLAAGAVDEADLYGGLFDDAFVEIWRVPYEGLDVPRRLGAGWVGKISQSARGYKMEVLGPGARLDQRPVVQSVTPQCRWKFGDSRCGVDVASFAIAGTVTSGLNRGTFLAVIASEPIGSGTGEVPSSGDLPAQFADGRILWLTGVNAGQTTETKSVDFATGQVVLWAQTVHVPEAGDTFELMPGCAQDFTTCVEIYGNGDRFGGFPHVPGQDAIIRSPNVKQS